MSEDTKNCFNCKNRTIRNTCAVKEVLAVNFNQCGAKYKKSAAISQKDVVDCTCWGRGL